MQGEQAPVRLYSKEYAVGGRDVLKQRVGSGPDEFAGLACGSWEASVHLRRLSGGRSAAGCARAAARSR